MTKEFTELEQALRDSLYLKERLDAPAGGEKIPEEQIEEWFADWRAALGDDGELFKRRFEWGELDRKSVRSALSHRPAIDESVEKLAARAEELLAAGDASELPDLPETVLDVEEPLPFEDAYLPFVRQTYSRIRTDFPDFFSAAARGHLVRELLKKYTQLGEQLLFEKFAGRRPAGEQFILSLQGPDEEPPTEKYEAFVEELKSGGWREIFVEYPVFTRLLVEEIERWLENSREFLNRLESDLDRIGETFFAGSTPDEVTKIEAGLSDSHFGGRSVKIIHFDEDKKIVYKPKPVDIEATFSRFVRWASEKMPRELYSHTVLPRADYGWVEFIEHRECEAEEEVEDYYYRSGELLALAHGLACTDLHQENLVAAGAQPVIIDYESLLHGQNHWLDELYSPAAGGVEEKTHRSVMRPGLLPVWRERQEEKIEIGGLSAREEAKEIKQRRLKAVNSDQVCYGFERKPVSEDKNVVRLDGERRPVTAYGEELVAGFEAGYEFLREHRTEIMKHWLEEFSGHLLRFIFRNTATYFQLRRELLTPDYLQTGVDFEIKLESLLRPFLNPAEKPDAWPLHRAEIEQMKRLDIPYFGVRSDSLELTEGVEDPLAGFLQEPGVDFASETLEEISEADRSFQVRFIEGSLAAIDSPEEGEEKMRPLAAEPEELEAGDFAAEVNRLRDRILERGIEQPDGSLTWLDIQMNMATEIQHFGPIGSDLYVGRAGVAIFLAAEDFVREETANREIVQKIYTSLREEVEANLASAGKTNLFANIGGYTGVGSYLYLFHHLADFYPRLDSRQFALEMIGGLKKSDVEQDEKFDLMMGSSGLLQVLLAIYEATGASIALERARWCGEHLLDNQQTVGGEGAAWDTIGEFPVTGMAHGAAGILIALHRLFRATGDDRHRKAVYDALTYEREAFVEAENNWPDFRRYHPYRDSKETTPFMVTWCAGAPGIVLSRLKLLDSLDDPRLEEEITAGLRTTTAEGPEWKYDHLCCGTAGRLEILRQAKNHPHINTTSTGNFSAEKRLKTMVASAQTNDGYRLSGDGMPPVGLFSGLAGIGYTLLRWQYPEKLPDVLVLE